MTKIVIIEYPRRHQIDYVWDLTSTRSGCTSTRSWYLRVNSDRLFVEKPLFCPTWLRRCVWRRRCCLECKASRFTMRWIWTCQNAENCVEVLQLIVSQNQNAFTIACAFCIIIFFLLTFPPQVSNLSVNTVRSTFSNIRSLVCCCGIARIVLPTR